MRFKSINGFTITSIALFSQIFTPAHAIGYAPSTTQRPTPPVIINVVADRPFSYKSNLTINFEHTFDPSRVRGTKVYVRWTGADGVNKSRTCSVTGASNTCVIKNFSRPAGAVSTLPLSITARMTINTFTVVSGSTSTRYAGTSRYSNPFVYNLEAAIKSSVESLTPGKLSAGKRRVQATFTIPGSVVGSDDSVDDVKIQFTKVGEVGSNQSCIASIETKRCFVRVSEGITYKVTSTTYLADGIRGTTSAPIMWTVGSTPYSP